MTSLINKKEKEIKKLFEQLSTLEKSLMAAKTNAENKMSADGDAPPETEEELKKIMVNFTDLINIINEKIDHITPSVPLETPSVSPSEDGEVDK